MALLRLRQGGCRPAGSRTHHFQGTQGLCLLPWVVVFALRPVQLPGRGPPPHREGPHREGLVGGPGGPPIRGREDMEEDARAGDATAMEERKRSCRGSGRDPGV
eukprot:4698575-Heterocapsa_arctica.AAC.1